MNRTFYVITAQEFFLRSEAEQQGVIVEVRKINGRNFRTSSKIVSIEYDDPRYIITTEDGETYRLKHHDEVEVESLTIVERRERITRSLVELLDTPLSPYNIARMQRLATELDNLNLQSRVERREAVIAQQNEATK